MKKNITIGMDLGDQSHVVVVLDVQYGKRYLIERTTEISMCLACISPVTSTQ